MTKSQRKRLPRWWGALLICLGLLPTTAVAVTNGHCNNSASALGTTYSDWMAEIHDSLYLSELSLPGTHNTMTYNFDKAIVSAYVKTQKMTLEAQLNAGIRVLDIRGRQATNNTITIHHGAYYLGFVLGNVLQTCEAFLDDHPKETILMRIREDHDPAADVTYSFGQTMDRYLNGWSNLFWTRDEPANGDEKDVPLLGDVRGKVVLLQDYAPSDGVDGTWSGLYYRQANIQDNWNDPGFAGKWDAVVNHFEAASCSGHNMSASHQMQINNFYLNYLSASGWDVNPYEYACGGRAFFGRYKSGMNQRALESWFANNPEGHFGAVMMDYPGYELVEAIIASN